MSRTGSAKLPLHGGKAPSWLFDRMEQLGGAIATAVIDEYGHQELLERLSDPYWFQSLGCVLGFDWHSSGLTTTTMGALKQALDLETHGVAVAGGKGSVSRRTPEEIRGSGLGTSETSRLVEASRKSAAVDNSCVQDSYSIYHHTTVFTETGEWCVVQQGMNDGYARRYHWLSDSVGEFTEEPQEAICSQGSRQSVLNLVSRESQDTREVSVDLVNDDPRHLRRYFTGQSSLLDFSRELEMPGHHGLRKADLTERSLEQLEKAYEIQPRDYEELISIEGIGSKSLRALSLVSEVVYGSEPDWQDPAKYSYAHGGKDGTPFPVDREVYDESIEKMWEAVEAAELGSSREEALKKLNQLSGR